MTNVTGDGWTGADLNHLVHAIMEHHANMRDAATEIKFGTNYGAQRALELTTSTLEPWGLFIVVQQMRILTVLVLLSITQAVVAQEKFQI